MENIDWDLLSSYIGLLTLATISIYAGAHGSLPNPKRDPTKPSNDEDDEEDDGERMSLGDAYLFPIIGSVALVGLYLIVKYFGKEWINWVLGWYFSIAGVGSVWKSCVSLLKGLLGESTWKKFDKLSMSAKKGTTPLFSLTWRTPSMFLLPIAVVPSAAYHFWTVGRRSVLVTDVLGLSFSHNALSLLKLDSFKTGCMLLAGLFVYDIWWVFGTEVMVKVATTLDLPIKLLWPKSLVFSGQGGYTMLGLGDIVIPGTFVALALRYDHLMFTKTPLTKFKSKPYFYATLTSYVLGLMTTMLVMHVFGKAQPALLYLSPACILSFLLTAVTRGELLEAWSWCDVPEERSRQDGVSEGVGDEKDGGKKK